MTARPVFFAIPGDLSLPTGGYAYDRHILRRAANHGLDLRHLALPASYPAPTPADLATTAAQIAATPGDAMLLIDGLAYGAMPVDLIRGFHRPIAALVHHPLGLESGMSESRARALIACETAAIALAQRIIVTSSLTARTLMQDFAAPQAKLVVAEPGTEPRPRARGSQRNALLSVGAISPRKAYDVLIAALAAIADAPWSLTIAGAVTRAPATFEELQRLVAARGLGDRVSFVGAVDDDELARLHEQADLFVMASLYEGYGMALAEAMAHGLPIVTTTGGAAAETVPDGAALKVPPGDVGALSAALNRALRNQPLLRQLADASWEAGQGLPRWDDAALRIARALREMAQ